MYFLIGILLCAAGPAGFMACFFLRGEKAIRIRQNQELLGQIPWMVACLVAFGAGVGMVANHQVLDNLDFRQDLIGQYRIAVGLLCPEGSDCEVRESTNRLNGRLYLRVLTSQKEYDISPLGVVSSDEPDQDERAVPPARPQSFRELQKKWE